MNSLVEFSYILLDWYFAISVIALPPVVCIFFIGWDIAESREAKRRYDVVVFNGNDSVAYMHVRYHFAKYTKEIRIITDDAREIWSSYDLVEISEAA